MTLSMNGLRRSFILVAVILAGALVLATAPATILADQQVDNTQRIEAFQPITISEDTLLGFEGLVEEFDQMTLLMVFLQLQELGEMDTNLSEQSFQKVDSLDDVDDHLNGAFVTPDTLPDGFSDGVSHAGIGEAGYVSFTVNVEAARTISQLLDIDPNWLPAASEHETLTITIDVPASGFASWNSGFDMLMVGQVDLPQIDIPEEMDLEALRDSILDDPRLPDELADQLNAIDNWETTVPVPVPEGAEYEDLQIDGGAGFLLTMDNLGGAVVWEVDGTLHIVAGNLDANVLQDVAESMQ